MLINSLCKSGNQEAEDSNSIWVSLLHVGLGCAAIEIILTEQCSIVTKKQCRYAKTPCPYLLLGISHSLIITFEVLFHFSRSLIFHLLMWKIHLLFFLIHTIFSKMICALLMQSTLLLLCFLLSRNLLLSVDHSNYTFNKHVINIQHMVAFQDFNQGNDSILQDDI